MINVSARMNPSDLAAFNRAMDRAVHITRRTADQALDWFGVRYAKSARALTPQAKKFRSVVDNPDGSDKAHPYAIEILRQQADPKYVPLKSRAGYRKHPQAEIKRRGLARKTWRRMAAKIAGRLEVDAGDSNGDNPFSGIPRGREPVVEHSGDQVRVLALEQMLTYVDKAVPGIASAAIGRAARGIEAEIERKHQAALDAAGVGQR